MADAIDGLVEAHGSVRLRWLNDEIEEVKEALGQRVNREQRDSLNQELRTLQRERRDLQRVEKESS